MLLFFYHLLLTFHKWVECGQYLHFDRRLSRLFYLGLSKSKNDDFHRHQLLLTFMDFSVCESRSHFPLSTLHKWLNGGWHGSMMVVIALWWDFSIVTGCLSHIISDLDTEFWRRKNPLFFLLGSSKFVSMEEWYTRSSVPTNSRFTCQIR